MVGEEAFVVAPRQRPRRDRRVFWSAVRAVRELVDSGFVGVAPGGFGSVDAGMRRAMLEVVAGVRIQGSAATHPWLSQYRTGVSGAEVVVFVNWMRGGGG